VRRQDDLKNRRKFLRRCELPTASLKDFYLGATVSVFSRELVITDYGDEFTKNALQVPATPAPHSLFCRPNKIFVAKWTDCVLRCCVRESGRSNGLVPPVRR
jgi:hypothetical protein